MLVTSTVKQLGTQVCLQTLIDEAVEDNITPSGYRTDSQGWKKLQTSSSAPLCRDAGCIIPKSSKTNAYPASLHSLFHGPTILTVKLVQYVNWTCEDF